MQRGSSKLESRILVQIKSIILRAMEIWGISLNDYVLDSMIIGGGIMDVNELKEEWRLREVRWRVV